MAIEKRQFSRSFKGEVKTGSAETIVTIVRNLLADRVISFISLANKAGKVISGSDSVLDAFRKGSPELLLLATDISPESAEKFIAAARKSKVEVYYLLSKDRLGASLGKELRSAAAIVQSGFVTTLRLELTRYGNFFEGGAW
jgi:ribosomal protein L7Ae-like RNA K-turn-binding protein